MLSHAKRYFSAYSTKVAIIGAGPAGHSISAMLSRSGKFSSGEITVFDKRLEHHYQPSYTMVGGGVLGDVEATHKVEKSVVYRPQSELFNVKKEITWAQQNVASVDPAKDELTLENGDKVQYEYLVIAPGLQLRFD
jgi:eukaryotic sulfide quinone oxidoreductase